MLVTSQFAMNYCRRPQKEKCLNLEEKIAAENRKRKSIDTKSLQ